jgi:hypothetical protein
MCATSCLLKLILYSFLGVGFTLTEVCSDFSVIDPSNERPL